MRYTRDELQQSIRGLLAFPVTPFTADNTFDQDVYRTQIQLLLASGVGTLFPAGGTGEFFSMTLGEYRTVVRTCVEEVAGRVPVVAGIGYGTAMACEFAQAAEEAGADAVLALPPYLVVPDQQGLEAHYRTVAAATRLGLIVYQRDNAIFEPETVRRLSQVPNIIGFKDGLGQVERLQFIREAVPTSFLFLNGMPTAEIHALTYAAHGITTYSSAILNFLPEIATKFYAAVVKGDQGTMQDLLQRVIWPLSRIRNRRAGYAVTLMKAGARLRGLPVGRVRPPLVEIAPTDEQDLANLLTNLGLNRPLVAGS